VKTFFGDPVWLAHKPQTLALGSATECIIPHPQRLSMRNFDYTWYKGLPSVLSVSDSDGGSKDTRKKTTAKHNDELRNLAKRVAIVLPKAVHVCFKKYHDERTINALLQLCSLLHPASVSRFRSVLYLDLLILLWLLSHLLAKTLLSQPDMRAL